MKRFLLALALGWLIGIATTLGAVVLTEGWFEYRFLTESSNAADPALQQLVTNTGGWEPVPNVAPQGRSLWVRRPRIRLGW